MTLPHWDLSDVYPGLESPGFNQAMKNLAVNLAARFDTKVVEQRIERYCER